MKSKADRHLVSKLVASVLAIGLSVVWANSRLAPTGPTDETAAQKLIDSIGKNPSKSMESSATVVLGAGCFWCIESQLETLKGVLDVESGYAGGTSKNVDYSSVSGGKTGHAEVVKVKFNPKILSEADLLRIFFVSHDPTQLNRQGGDYGTQYRSAVFYATPEERLLAEKIKAEISKAKLFDSKIVTTIEPLKNYVKAEDYHQDYYAKFAKATPEEQSKMNSGYCSYIVSPKLEKFRKQFKKLQK